MEYFESIVENPDWFFVVLVGFLVLNAFGFAVAAVVHVLLRDPRPAKSSAIMAVLHIGLSTACIYWDYRTYSGKKELKEAIETHGMKDPRTIALLLRQVESQSAADIRKVGETRSSSFILPLIAIRTKSDDDEKKMAALNALEGLGKASESITPLLASYGEDFDSTRDQYYSDYVTAKHMSLLEQFVVSEGNNGIDLAMRVLDEHQNSEVFEKLVELLVALTTQHEDDYAEKKLIDLARAEKEKPRGVYAIRALPSTREHGGAELLLEIAGSEDSPDTPKWNRLVAISALGRLEDERAANLLISLIANSNDTQVQKEAVEALVETGHPDGASAVLPLITDWDVNTTVAGALEKLGWSPDTSVEQVHFWVAKRDGSELKANWSVVSEVLLVDIRSRERSQIRNAVNAFIGIGRAEILPTLMSTLNSKGNKTMAEVYLNSGSAELRTEAERWAAKRGYAIETGSGAHPVAWGSFDR